MGDELGFVPAPAGSQPAARSGLLADRGDPATYVDQTYWAEDDNGGAWYRSDGTTWHLIGPRKTSLGRKERTAASGAPGMEAAFTVVTVLADLDAFTVTSRGKPYKIRARLPLVTVSTTNNGAQGRIRDITGLSAPAAGDGVGRAFAHIESVRAGGGGSMLMEATIDDPAGTQRTFRVEVTRVGSGTGSVTVYADNDAGMGKAFIEAIEE